MKSLLRYTTSVAALALATQMAVAGPETVSGPGADPECFAPVSEDTPHFKWEAREGPYKVALVNGFIANDWRVQMIAVAKAYAQQPDVAAELEEFKVVSVGEDIAAQIAAANNFIDQGFDAIIINANNTAAFGSVVRKANAANVVVLSFDNVIDDPNQIAINVDQKGLGKSAAEFLLSKTDADPAKFLHVRGPAGQPVDIARNEGFHEVIDASGRTVEVTDVVGNWAPGDSQKVTADAIAAGGVFDGIYVQGGSQGATTALLDAGHPLVPITGETENAFRQLCNEKGLECQSGGTGPAQSSVTIKTAIAALKGEVVPQQIALPTSISYAPFEEGVDVFPELPGSFFAGNNFDACNIGFTAEEIASQTGDDN
ncbi:substrate-binding domain-containing protein [Oricola thermophila]|uniref:Substrate-binding domain-containing protein n=1 Tax=Oricola thermophila TaxID=2742145 RepID=A0A6N1VJG4_9HYPH|nr:substrate-binding domain-containing protein [Oricola thermophila]QKV19047.1 substrate-binding domain-containing protein [Oricola thermophila]